MLAWLLLVSGCGVSASASRKYVPAEIQPGPGESVISKSTPDKSNRYAAVVLVEGGRGTCSGVLISPRSVLTAAHCVCAQREAKPGQDGGGTIIDKTTCVRTAFITVMTYQFQASPSVQVIPGIVTPHDELRIIYDEEEKEVSSHADIAVLTLRESPQGVKPLRLATSPVRYTQPVTLVGYGSDRPDLGMEGTRRFGFNEIASVSESGATFLVGKPIQIQRPYKPKEMLLVREEGSYSLKGDSGGPCLRERDGVMELVGIAKTRYGGHALVQFSEYTSISFYLQWLRQEIAMAERRRPD
jgi:hypothetical protein